MKLIKGAIPTDHQHRHASSQQNFSVLTRILHLVYMKKQGMFINTPSGTTSNPVSHWRFQFFENVLCNKSSTITQRSLPR